MRFLRPRGRASLTGVGRGTACSVRSRTSLRDSFVYQMFSLQVEDRREKVEVQLKVFEEKFSLLKENYDSKLRELQKTKLHNAQLLGLVGGRGGGEEHSARLEELLEVERERNRLLSDRLDSLEKSGVPGQVVTEEQVVVVKDGSNEGDGGQHTTSPEFAYMAGLVKELKSRVGELQGQMQAQLRQNLQDSDKLREMARKLNLAETSLKQARFAVICFLCFLCFLCEIELLIFEIY